MVEPASITLSFLRMSIMKHAGPGALDQIESLLGDLRSFPSLDEKGRGVFYRKSKAFLHFHEDPTGLCADVRVGEEFERHRVETKKERATFLKIVEAYLGTQPAKEKGP
jgi:hypothetical protein